MVACINIPYWVNRSAAAAAAASAVAAADGSAVSCFLRVSDHLESICKIFFSLKILNTGTSGTPNGLKRVKNTKPPTRPPPTDFTSRVC